MKVFSINSSPRPESQSKTALLLNRLVKGMRDAGAEVYDVALREKKVNPCQGCGFPDVAQFEPLSVNFKNLFGISFRGEILRTGSEALPYIDRGFAGRARHRHRDAVRGLDGHPHGQARPTEGVHGTKMQGHGRPRGSAQTGGLVRPLTARADEMNVLR